MVLLTIVAQSVWIVTLRRQAKELMMIFFHPIKIEFQEADMLQEMEDLQLRLLYNIRVYAETDMEAQIHHLEQEAYSSVLRAFKAQDDAITRAVRCITFSEEGKYVLSSAAGGRYIAIWEVDGSTKKSSYCVLAMDHPAIFIDAKSIGAGGIYVFSISEIGVCYLWDGINMENCTIQNPQKYP